MNVLLNGARGGMGCEVAKAIENSEQFKIVCGIDRIKGEGVFPIYDNFQDITEKVDVIIDFSVPVATMNVLEYAKNNKIPAVIATTGLNEEQEEKVKETSRLIPIFRSANMSLDINLMADIVQKVAEVLSDSDIEIVDTHHNRKIDSPSGTAILLADAINKVFNDNKKYEFNRMQKREKRDKNEIGFSSIRGGNIVGEHSVIFFGENESLEIKHTAYSRQVFAQGALKAAEFIVKQEPGLYNMDYLVK